MRWLRKLGIGGGDPSNGYARIELDQQLALMERIQAVHYATFPRSGAIEAPMPTSREEQAAHIERRLTWLEGQAGVDVTSLDREWRRTLVDPRMSRFEDPIWFSHLRDICDHVERTIPQLGLRCEQPPLFGTLPTGRVNGLAFVEQGRGQPVIFVDDGVFGFANLVAKIFCQCIPVASRTEGGASFGLATDVVADHVEESAAQLAERMTDLVVAMAIEGHPHAARQYWPEARMLNLIVAARDAMEYFVVAHEYGHAIAGHLQPSRRLQFAASNRVCNEVRPSSWTDEHEADALGLFLVVQALTKKHRLPAELFLEAVALYLESISLVVEVQAILQGDTGPSRASATHPPIAERIEQMRRRLPTFMGESDRIDGYANVADIMRLMVWPKVLLALDGRAAAGVKPRRLIGN